MPNRRCLAWHHFRLPFQHLQLLLHHLQKPSVSQLLSHPSVLLYQRNTMWTGWEVQREWRLYQWWAELLGRSQELVPASPNLPSVQFVCTRLTLLFCFHRENKKISIPVTVVVGILVIIILIAITRCFVKCCTRKPQRSTTAGGPRISPANSSNSRSVQIPAFLTAKNGLS